MRLGAPVYGWKTAEEWALCHVKKGYGAAYWPLPVDAQPETEDAFVRAAGRHNLVIAEVGVWNNLLDPDFAQAEANRRYCVARMKQAERVGARCCVNISGSCSSRWDGPHRDNLTEKTFDRIVKLTQSMLDEAALSRSSYALEPMPWMYPVDAESTKALIRAVGRPSFAVHVDMVNMINSPEKVYKTGELTKRYFSELTPFIRSVHVKDIMLSSQLTTHLSEVIAGTGDFDLSALLSECARLDDLPVMAEHLKDEAEYDEAVKNIRAAAESLGLRFDAAE